MQTANLFALALLAGALLILCAWRTVVVLRLLAAAYATAQIAGRRFRTRIRRMKRALSRSGADSRRTL